MRECKCGATFETLSAYRLHQRDDCTFSEEENVEGDDIDAIAERITEEVLVCDVCEQFNEEGAEGFSHEVTTAGLSVTAEFTCTYCGATNTNTAILE